MDIITKYFPDLTPRQLEQFEQLGELYKEWNEKINVISRKDIDQLYERHVLHSMGIAKYIQFTPGTKIMDVGTGGGFPGIPLAILFPETNFRLVDSIAKKIKVVEGVSQSLGLTNVLAEQARAEKVNDEFDFVVSRAVTAFPKFVSLVRRKISASQKNSMANGILYLKGGDFLEELEPFKKQVQVFPLSDQFEEAFFETKKLIHLRLKKTGK
ncbi:16S rRNA (guanine(527)-N(7))-methyltransferase RsmG [Sunxiuqinia elliptica]|uniref:Ribosomal RNA small subunit methyltransferase G n=1 Tax=Sunxiuqinia elliptica TaxID=655355 RepID=A0A4R6H422_9BACT|nr:16S rRNA (guanine(527)-N(7))-methyltransferase RsmG [Sunxiuqinia elliptica]TDO02634.1 16S rRNA m(7)G-527 methyltransferase [Sunxiuqinia elliptica]TDO58628.1 16S rRNA m(7)G-527 methyltransferase [Sunxiuqinia elliptica]